MYTHVLVPLDGSALAEMALHEARRLIAAKAQLTLVSAIDLPDIPLYGFDAVLVNSSRVDGNEMMRYAKEYLENTAAQLRAEGYEVNILAEFSEPADLIVETARQLKPDAIIMSTHGRSGISRWLFGSVTNKVLSAAPCPILVIPSKVKQEATPSSRTASVDLS
jgi:nucleotide-binding universal stress UspA family protein